VVGARDGDFRGPVVPFLKLWQPQNSRKTGQSHPTSAPADATHSQESLFIWFGIIWLNEFGLDIRCVRMRPYADGDQLLIEVQTVIPLPEIADHQIQIQAKRREVRKARRRPKFNITVANRSHKNLSKRHMMLRLVSEAIKAGKTPDDIRDAIAKADPRKLFDILDGELTEKEEVIHALELKEPKQDPVRYFHEKGEFFCSNGNTYVLSNQWGATTLAAALALRDTFPDLNIQIDEIDP